MKPSMGMKWGAGTRGETENVKNTLSVPSFEATRTACEVVIKMMLGQGVRLDP